MTPDGLARQNGFDYAQYIGNANGLYIYCGAMNAPQAAIGWPQHIIEDRARGVVRMATVAENDRLMDLFPYGADPPPDEDEDVGEITVG